MEISLANAKKLNWLWQDEHEIEWIETFVKIIDKSTEDEIGKLLQGVNINVN